MMLSRYTIEAREGMAWAARATHCVNGHPFDEENTYRRADFGWRRCRACDRERSLERMRMRRMAG